MWVIKTHGKTFYVDHVSSDMPWSTKETPDNSHTKGSLKFKEVLLTIDDSNSATLRELNIYDKFRLQNQKLGITRIMFKPGTAIHKALQNNEYKHSPFKFIIGACTSSFVVCDLLNKSDATFVSLKHTGEFRVLMPNEGYYKEYDDVKDGRIKANYSDPDTPYEYS
jgi:hypothetical protein